MKLGGEPGWKKSRGAQARVSPPWDPPLALEPPEYPSWENFPDPALVLGFQFSQFSKKVLVLSFIGEFFEKNSENVSNFC